MGDHGPLDDLEERLRALGGAPVAAAVQRGHLAAMAAVASDPAAAERGRWRFTWRAVAAACVAGFLAGSTGLAAAGSLPDPAQDVAHDVLGAVGIDVPRSTEGCPEGRTYRNHGQYVSEVEAVGGDVEAAAHSECGKPLPGGGRGNGNGGGQPEQTGVPRVDTDGNPCTGPPPWAGAHLPREQRRALQAEHRSLCGDEGDTDVAVEEPAVEEHEAEDGGETTTSVAAEPTTTTAVETTTTTVDETTTTTIG